MPCEELTPHVMDEPGKGLPCGGEWDLRAWARGGLACAVAGREYYSVAGLHHGLSVSSNNTNKQVNRETKPQKARTAE